MVGNGRCYDGNKDGPLVGDVCVNTYVFAGNNNNNKCPAKNEEVVGTRAPSPVVLKMVWMMIHWMLWHVKKDVNLFKHVMNERYGQVQGILNEKATNVN